MPERKNLLLAGLSKSDYQKLLPDLQRVTVKTKQTVQNAREKLEFVYFPNGGVFSITAELLDGNMVEVATVGAEGMLGIEAFLGADPIAPGRMLLQVPDTDSEADAMRLSVDAFRRACAERRTLHDLMGRYAQSVVAQMMQSTACNALHNVNERCARWLLMTHDRMHRRDFQLSHEFLAMMLGVQRPTVSLVAATLQASGLISYNHGHVCVVNREGLEEAACACYGVMRRYFEGVNLSAGA
jgi:CRP-like cAMP-binding protein